MCSSVFYKRAEEIRKGLRVETYDTGNLQLKPNQTCHVFVDLISPYLV